MASSARPSPFAAARLGAPADVAFLRRELAAGALAPNGREEGRRGETCLCKAAGGGREAAVEALLAGGAHPDVRSLAGDAPLHLAAARGTEGCVRLLLGRGCNHRASDRGRRTALHLAAFRGRREIVALLLDHDAAVRRGERGLQVAPRGPKAREAATFSEERDSLGFTALHLAAKQGHAGVVGDLLRAGAEANVRNSRGGWALHDAVRSRNRAAAAALLRGGARLGERDERGRLPEDLAVGAPAMLRVLGGDLAAAEEPAPAAGAGADMDVGVGTALPPRAPTLSGQMDTVCGESAPEAATRGSALLFKDGDGPWAPSSSVGGGGQGGLRDWQPFEYGRRPIADAMDFDF